MKLYIGNKNTPFALDVSLDGATLSYSIRAIMQREFVGDPTRRHPNGGLYFDESRVTEWRGNYAVFGDPIHERSINVEALRQHPDFSDHAAFMIYAPVGVAADQPSRDSFYQQTPNLYAMTIASKMDAQAYHATVLQSHPLGQILVPLRSCPTSEWTLGFNVHDPVLLKTSGDIEVIPAITLGLVREETLPVVRFVGGPSATVQAAGELPLTFRLETPDGTPITDREADVYIESTGGYLSARRVTTVGGSGSTVLRPDGLAAGESVKVKVGFKLYTGTDDMVVAVQ